jgi:hypothetical protein
MTALLPENPADREATVHSEILGIASCYGASRSSPGRRWNRWLAISPRWCCAGSAAWWPEKYPIPPSILLIQPRGAGSPGEYGSLNSACLSLAGR